MVKSTFLATLLSIAATAGAEPSFAADASFQLGIHDPGSENGDALPFDRQRDSGASISRITIFWSQIIGGTEKPAGFEPRNPADPNYDWSKLDRFVLAAKSRGIEPLVTTYWAPDWAEAARRPKNAHAGTWMPDHKEYADFLHAMAMRYSGEFVDPRNPGLPLPRVRYFQIWNEPNFGQYLTASSKARIPIHYAKLLNAGYDSLKAVHADNTVVTAGLGPFGNNGYATDVDPQVFMRSVLCLTGKGGRKLRDKAGCKVPKAKFDVWAQHPYTFGGEPTSRAGSPDGASIGNMPDIKRTLDFAVRSRNVVPAGRKQLWVTEFAWFVNPPGLQRDGRQLGATPAKQAQLLSESAYRLWRLKFRALVWYSLVDLHDFPVGLYFGQGADAKPRPVLDAFRFPFYADESRKRLLVWGIVGRGGKTKVRIERRSGNTWRPAGEVTTKADGLFNRRIRGGAGEYRAVAVDGAKAGLTSHSFRAR